MAKNLVGEIVDTNILIRYLVGDDPKQQSQAQRWFREAERGKRKLVIKPIVVAETCFVLESFYQKKRGEIADAFEVILSQKWLLVEERKVLLKLFFWYCQGLHFVDSYLISWAQENKASVLSFDQKVKKKFRAPGILKNKITIAPDFDQEDE